MGAWSFRVVELCGAARVASMAAAALADRVVDAGRHGQVEQPVEAFRFSRNRPSKQATDCGEL